MEVSDRLQAVVALIPKNESFIFVCVFSVV
jgi:hypothetical protein